MSTWKLTIKPNHEEKFDPFKMCKDKSLLGVGWSKAYATINPKTEEEALSLIKKRYGKIPSAINNILFKVKVGDHVWIHKNGKFYLCVVQEGKHYGKSIDPDFIKYDIGHAICASWQEIPEQFVSGSIQRGMIAQRMIQRIRITTNELKYQNFLLEKLRIDPEWHPEIDDKTFADGVAKLSSKDLLSFMTPDEIEDLVSLYLQSEGWFLLKSTCFRSKPKFEFMLINTIGEFCSVQVKSGKNPISLPPSKYEEHLTENRKIYLFSTNEDPYPGKPVEDIICLSPDDLITWFKANTWAVSVPLKCRLSVLLDTRS